MEPEGLAELLSSTDTAALSAELDSAQFVVARLEERCAALQAELGRTEAELAAECGVTQWERVPTIGLDGEFIDDLASAVIEALPKMDEQPLQEINEGRPVSLRVVNDLVQLKSKDTLALFDEFGPIRYNAPQRVGFTTRAELINGRIAMVAITAASALSISQGNFWDRVLDGALPFQFW